MKIIIGLALAASTFITMAGQCGIPPIPPTDGSVWMCLCNSQGYNCRWVLVKR